MRSENFDNLFKQEVNGLEGLPPSVSWSKEAGWEKLNARLSDSVNEKKILPFGPVNKIFGSYWTYAAAASVAALVVASVYFVGSYLSQRVGQTGAVALTGTTDTNQVDIGSDKQNQPILEQSILFHPNLGEMTTDDIEDKTKPMVIADRRLLSQLLMYHAVAPGNNVSSPDKFKVFQPGLNRLKPYRNALPPLMKDNDQITAFKPWTLPVGDEIKNKHVHTVNNTSMAVFVKGNLGAVSQNFNIGLEGSVLFKLPGLDGKKRDVFGVGVDTRYQFYSGTGVNQAQDDLTVPNKDNVKNGFNTFVTASYSHNISKKTRKPFWVGMKAGYLVQDSSNSFEDKTLLLEMIVGGNDSSKFKVSPQVYLTDNFKKVMPGIKLGMTLGKFEKDVAI